MKRSLHAVSCVMPAALAAACSAGEGPPAGTGGSGSGGGGARATGGKPGAGGTMKADTGGAVGTGGIAEISMPTYHETWKLDVGAGTWSP